MADRPVRNVPWPPGDGKFIYLQDATDAGKNMNHAGLDISTLYGWLGAKIESLGGTRPWGTDQTGQQCDKNYNDIAPKILEIWKEVGEAVQTMGTNIQTASANIAATDHAGGVQIQQAGTTEV